MCKLKYLRLCPTEMRCRTFGYDLCQRGKDSRVRLRWSADLSFSDGEDPSSCGSGSFVCPWEREWLPSSSSPETLFTHEDGISRPVNSHSTSFTPSRPRGPTLGLAPANPDLSLPSSEVLIAPNLGDPLPPGAPPVAIPSDLVPWGRNTPKQYS